MKGNTIFLTQACKPALQLKYSSILHVQKSKEDEVLFCGLAFLLWKLVPYNLSGVTDKLMYKNIKENATFSIEWEMPLRLILQQDNDPKDTSNFVQAWFRQCAIPRFKANRKLKRKSKKTNKNRIIFNEQNYNMFDSMPYMAKLLVLNVILVSLEFSVIISRIIYLIN